MLRDASLTINQMPLLNSSFTLLTRFDNASNLESELG